MNRANGDAPASDRPPEGVPPESRPPASGPPASGPRRHRQRPGLWFPVILIAALLAGGAAVGRFVVPAGVPDPGAQPPAQGITPGRATPTTAQPTATGPALPTPPARPADQLAEWAAKVAAAVDAPAIAIQAYGFAQLALAQLDPQCRLSWTTLAGIGEVESRHGQADGAVLQPSGRSSPVVMGPVLDGRNGRPLVTDTDAGAFDGDSTYDRAVGPLHLMPSAWRAYAIDADGDAIVDPFDLDDAALTLGRLLCSGTEDLAVRSGWNTAIARYRDGNAYRRTVFAAADKYGEQTKSIT